MTRSALTLGLLGALVPSVRADEAVDEPKAGTMLRMFTDSDKVSVRAFMTDWSMLLKGNNAINLHWNNELVTVPGISAPVGSAEAVDAITTASRPISGNAYQDYIKTRNEVTGEISRPEASVMYYLSHESDYLAQQVAASANRDLHHQQLNLSVGTSYGWDRIEPLADDDTQGGVQTKTTLHANAVATQVLTPTTVLRVGAEINEVEGLQHNPYRNVYAGGTNVPERHPESRMRRDAFLKVNQYLRNRSSLKLSYRLYNDDWGISSHEIGTKLSQYVTPAVSARYEYRYYTQTAARFYRDEYASVNGIDGYRSGDYRMDELASHLFGVALNVDLDSISSEHPTFGRMGLWFNYERYFNSNNYSADILETGLQYRF